MKDSISFLFFFHDEIMGFGSPVNNAETKYERDWWGEGELESVHDLINSKRDKETSQTLREILPSLKNFYFNTNISSN